MFCSVYMHYVHYFRRKKDSLEFVSGPPSCLLLWRKLWLNELFQHRMNRKVPDVQNSINGKKKKRMSELLLSRCEVPRAESHQLSLS